MHLGISLKPHTETPLCLCSRHERLDTLCGSEFEGFRGVPCGRDNCELNVNNNRGEFLTTFLCTYILRT